MEAEEEGQGHSSHHLSSPHSLATRHSPGAGRGKENKEALSLQDEEDCDWTGQSPSRLLQLVQGYIATYYVCICMYA